MEEFHLPQPDIENNNDMPSKVRQETVDYNRGELALLATEREGVMNEEQRAAYNAFLNSVTHGPPAICSLSAVGDSGKTFLLNALGRRTRSQVIYHLQWHSQA